MMTHIGIVISDMGAGGAQRAVTQLSSAWVENGQRVTIFTLEPVSTTPFFALDERVHVARLNLTGQSQSIFSALMANFKRIRALRGAFAVHQPDVILAFLPDMVLTSVLAARGVPVMACERTDPRVYPTGVWRMLRDISYKFCTKIICQTPRAAEFFKCPDKTVVIPNPVTKPNVTGMSDIPLPPRKFISSLGRLSFEKGHDVFINAFALIADEFADVDLLLIGDGAERDNLEKQTQLINRIIFTGASKNPFPVMAKSEIFVLPSRFEGFPNALAEAMALGLPVIATDNAHGGLIKNGENGLLVPADDVTALAAFLRDLLNNPVKAQKLGQSAAHIVNDLSPKAILEQWDKIIGA